MSSSLRPLHPRVNEKRMDVGQEVFLTRVEGNTKWLNVMFLLIIQDKLTEWAKAWLRLNGLMDTLLHILEIISLLKRELHDRIDMRESIRCRRFVVLKHGGA